jgi:hypothetical protein
MGWLIALGPLIPVLVTQVEKLFGKKSGTTKLDTVLSAVTPILTSLTNAQALGGPMPPQADIVAEINAVVAKLYPPGTTYSVATDPLATLVPPTLAAHTSPLASAPSGSSPSTPLSSDQKIQLVVALVKALIS